MYKSISSDWCNWVKLNKSNNCDLAEMFTMMIKNGNNIKDSFELVFNEEPYKTKNWFKSTSNKIKLTDKDVDIVVQIDDPEIIVFGNFLSKEECNELISLSEKRLIPSVVVDSTNGGHMLHEARTSNNSYYNLQETSLICTIEKRISELIGLPVNNGEGLQVLNYPPEKQYKPHYDYFSYTNAESLHLKNGGQRIGTFIMYLNDVEEGGETTFPQLNIKVIPKKGNALFFSYTNDKDELDTRSLHAGNPVIVGNKWIATKWLRQNSTIN